MNRRILLILLILLSIALMFVYRNISTQGQVTDLDDPELYPLSQDQHAWLSDKKELTLAITDDAFPLFQFTRQGDASGMLSDFINYIGSGYDTEIVYVPILRRDAEPMLINGEVDAILSMHNLAYDHTIAYTMPLIEVKGILMYENTMSLMDSRDGTGFSVLIVDGDPSILMLQESYPQMELLFSESTEDAVRRLKEGEANAIAGSEPALIHYLGRDYISGNLVRAQGYLFEKNYCLGVDVENDTLYEILNNAIYHMNNGQILTDLQSKWMGISYPLYTESIIEKFGVILLIMFAAVLCVFFVFYQSNKSLYEELQQRMELLRESQNEMQTTFDGVTYYLAEVNREGKIVDINKAMAQRLEIRRHSAIGLPLAEVFRTDESVTKQLKQLIDITFEEEKEHGLDFALGRGIFEAHTFTIKDNREKVQKILLMIIDVTDQRSTERQMLQDNKMIAIGQLAAGIAHEIRNPLGLIRNYCYVLKNIDQTDTVTRDEAIKVIEKSVDKSGRIIENLLNFSRMTSNKKEVVNLYVQISNVIDLQRNWLDARGIDIYYRFTGTHDAVVNTEAIELILINLISNAADAISGQQGKIEVSCLHKEKRHIVLTIRDNGEGIPPEIKEDIFNPFFTTKQKREGNGLGLYIVYNEVSKMGGDLQLDSEVGAGSVFTITIPIEEVSREGVAAQ